MGGCGNGLVGEFRPSTGRSEGGDQHKVQLTDCKGVWGALYPAMGARLEWIGRQALPPNWSFHLT